MHEYDQFLLKNKAWVQEKLELDETSFDTLSTGQQTSALWIGYG
ncbi:hypothetical protein [Larkinella harenae]